MFGLRARIMQLESRVQWLENEMRNVELDARAGQEMAETLAEYLGGELAYEPRDRPSPYRLKVREARDEA